MGLLRKERMNKLRGVLIFDFLFSLMKLSFTHKIN